MKDVYQQTSYYYNDIYEKRDPYDVAGIELDPVIQKALKFAAEGSALSYDIGCGSGELALTLLNNGVKQIVGLDLSYHGISLARRSATACFSTLRSKWVWSGIEALRQFPADSADSIVLSRVLQELRPQEGLLALSEVHRLIRPSGRLVVVLQQDLPRPEGCSEIEIEAEIQPYFEEIRSKGWALNDGRFLWEITPDEVVAYCSDHFQLARREETAFGEVVLSFQKITEGLNHAARKS